MLSHQVLIPKPSEIERSNASSKAHAWKEEHTGLFRSMNRAAVMLTDCVLDLDPEWLKRLRGTQTALYCAVDQCTVNQEDIVKYLESADKNPWPAFSANIPPKWTLQSYIGLTGVPPTLLLGIEGGVHTFNHGVEACRHALTQAHRDLLDGSVKYALVCTVASSEDPLTVHKHMLRTRAARFNEGAAAVLLGPDCAAINFPAEPSTYDSTFGVADPLMRYLLKESPGGH